VEEPISEDALLFLKKDKWSEREYLAVETNNLVEFSNGSIEVLPMPTTSHQLLVAYLWRLLETFVTNSGLGTAAFAALRVRLWPGKIREPDIVFMLARNASQIGEKYWSGADLVMEVVSGRKRDRQRDLITKRGEYARAKISEYWIVDPKAERILVLRLAGERYVVHGEFTKGSAATSHLLPGFSVDVSAAFAQKLPAPRSPARRKKQR
jgi:Uma2 family endonuclease